MSRDVFLPILGLSALIRSPLAASLYVQVRLQEEQSLSSRKQTAQCQQQGEKDWPEEFFRKYLGRSVLIYNVWNLKAMFTNLEEKGEDQEGFSIILKCPSCTGRPLAG